MKVTLTVVETLTHEITIDVDEGMREQLRSEDVDPDDASQVEAWFRDLDEDDQLITDEIGDDTVTAVTDRSVDGVKVED